MPMTPQLGRPIAELAATAPPRVSLPRGVQILSPASAPFTTANMVAAVGEGIGSGAWLSVNDPLAMPFYLDRPETAFQLGWRNGSSAGGNWDVGIYDSAWARLISTGSTGGTGNSTYQLVDIADTVLPARVLLYLVVALDNVTGNRLSRWAPNVSEAIGMLGVMSSTTDAFPLPNPLTNMVDTSGSPFITFPEVFIVLRSFL